MNLIRRNGTDVQLDPQPSSVLKTVSPNKKPNISISLSQDTLDDIREIGREEMRSRSQMIEILLIEAIRAREER
uniref:Putative ribbon-helix-helix protein repressor n=1 Tax=viral metagenome TaxID=1070528 RepID=A0A6M3LWQ8_9ZZZZ